MPNDDPLPNMTAEERKIWQQEKISNRGGAELASNTGRSSIQNLIDSARRAVTDRANDRGHDRDDSRDR